MFEDKPIDIEKTPNLLKFEITVNKESEYYDFENSEEVSDDFFKNVRSRFKLSGLNLLNVHLRLRIFSSLCLRIWHGISWFEKQYEKDKEDEVSDDDLDSLKSFIDDSEVENDRTFYQQFENVSNSIADILKEEYDKIMGKKVELSNLCETSEGEGEIYDLKDSEKRIDRFKENRSKNDNCNSFATKNWIL